MRRENELIKAFTSKLSDRYFYNNFRQELKDFSSEELECILKNYSRHGLDFLGHFINYIPTYLAEKNGEYEIDKNIIEYKERHLIGCGLRKGVLILNGDAGSDIGSYMKDGKIIVNGNVKVSAGYRMKNGKIIITGNAGIHAGNNMLNGLIICLGEIKIVSSDIHGGKIYAGGFGHIPKSAKRFVKSLELMFKEDYENFGNDCKNTINELVKEYPEKLCKYANNRQVQKLFADILGKDQAEITLEYERSMRKMW